MTTPGGAPLAVLVNGAELLLAGDRTLEGLLEQVDIDAKGVAIALDGEVVPRSLWPITIVHPGAHVEIVTAVAGG